MVSKTQNNIGFLCVGFIIGFVSGCSYTYHRKLKKVPPEDDVLEKFEHEPELDSEPEPDLDSVGDSTPVNYVTTYRDT